MLRQAMTLEIITTLAAAGESETLEFKETTGTRREAAKLLPFRVAVHGSESQVEARYKGS